MYALELRKPLTKYVTLMIVMPIMSNSEVETILTINVYNLTCDTLCKPRLPFQASQCVSEGKLCNRI
jgi:hypothetical protein